MRLINTELKSRIERNNEDLLIVYCTTKLVAQYFWGKGKKADQYYRYKNVEQMLEAITEYTHRYEARYTEREKEKALKKSMNENFNANDKIKEGDVVYNSWGYEQTNIEFYKVVRVTKKTIDVVELNSKVEEGSEYSHGMACNVLAGDEFLKDGEKYTLRVSLTKHGIRLSNPKPHYNFNMWDSRPLYMSWYY